MANAMKLQRQGYQECALASLAMLADVSLEDVRQEATKRARAAGWSSWSALTSDSRVPDQSARLWYKIYRELAEVYLGARGLKWSAQLTTNSPVLSGNVPPLVGRGTLAVRLWRDAICLIAHAVAYEDGMIYDPEQTAPEPFGAFMERIQAKAPGALVAITVEPLEREGGNHA